MEKKFEKVLIGLLGDDGKESATTFGNFVNSNSNTSTMVELCDEIKKDENALRKFSLSSFLWLLSLKDKMNNGNFDDRNEAACNYGEKAVERVKVEIWEVLEESDRINPEDSLFAIKFCERMQVEHRTLQQSFTKLVDCWLETIGYEFCQPIALKILTAIPKDERRFPLI